MLRYIKYCLLLLLLLLQVPLTLAQTPVQDSIKIFMELDSMITTIVGENNPAQGLQLSQRQEAIAQQLQIDTLIIKAATNKGQIFGIFGFADLALKEYYGILKRTERLHLPGSEPRVLYSMGLIYQGLGDYKKSTEFFRRNKARLIETHHFDDTTTTNYELGFNMIANFEQSADSNDIVNGIAIIEQNLARAKEQHNERSIVLGLDNLSNIYLELEQYNKSLAYLKDIFNYPKGVASNYRRTAINEHVTELYVVLQQWDSAKVYLEKAFTYARLLGSKDWLQECYKVKAKIDEATGNYKDALQAKKMQLALKDSISRQDYENKIAAMTSIYDLEKKQGQIVILEKDKQQQQFQKKVILLGALLLVGLVVLALLVWLQRRTRQMQVAFSRSLLQNQEAERQRISSELHDSIGQNILFIRNQLCGHNAGAALAPVMDTITATIDDVRNISKELYPNQLEKFGLAAAVDALAEKVQQATGIFVSADLQEIDALLNREVKINFFRIIQEALNNVIKHADAKAVRITGNVVKHKIVLAIMDNGKGFDTGILERKAQTSYGMLNMEERARMLQGRMTLQSTTTGTKIVITIPI